MVRNLDLNIKDIPAPILFISRTFSFSFVVIYTQNHLDLVLFFDYDV